MNSNKLLLFVVNDIIFHVNVNLLMTKRVNILFGDPQYTMY